MERKKNYERIKDKLIHLIAKGELKPGEQLDSVEQLAKHYSVSRSAIREALSALQAIGLVEIKHGQGTYVKKTDLSSITHPISAPTLLNQEEMIHFFEVRRIIESGTASAAAARRTDANLTKMKLALKEMEQSGKQSDLGEKADVHFHLAIAEATQNHMLVQLMNSISDTLSSTMKASRQIWFFTEETTLEQLYQEHLAIYQAILDQNPPLAQELMLSHLRKVEAAYLRAMNNPTFRLEERN